MTRRSWLAGATGVALGLGAGIPSGYAARATREDDGPLAEPRIANATRRDRGYWVREQVARAQHEIASTELVTNVPVDPSFYTKGLAHAADGAPDMKAVESLFVASRANTLQAIEALPLSGERRQKNPLGGSTVSLWGMDPCAGRIPPPPTLASVQTAAEAIELYWLALARDVPFTNWHSDPIIVAAGRELSGTDAYAALREGASITPDSVFRTAIPGALHGPFISQFMWKPFQAGANLTQQRIRTYQPGFDYLVTWDDWLACQQGRFGRAAQTGALRFVHSLRDLAVYAHRDFSYQFFLQAALVIFDLGPTLDADDYDLPYDDGHPYRHSRKQCAFATFGPPQVLELVAVAAGLALRAAWWQKWNTQPFLRPEEYGGMVHRKLAGKGEVPEVSPLVLRSEALKRTFAKNGTYLLPSAYPEGSPMHPAYPSGHATIAGACVTILKAMFDESYVLTRPVVATGDGLNLASYEGPALTLGGELDKLAWNVALGRLAAGIHWRADGHWGMRLGEQVALSVLRDWKETVPETPFTLSLTSFDGEQLIV